jgi:hypothetical protein
VLASCPVASPLDCTPLCHAERVTTTTQDAYDVLAFIYDPSTDYKTLIKRDQSADAKRARSRRVPALTGSLRAEGMIEQADVIERYHAMVDEYVDGQQALDPASIGSATRDDGRWLARTYDHARRLMTQR